MTEGTDAQATVSVRMEEEGRIVTGASADTDTVVASVKAYVNALNKLMVRRQKSAPDSDKKSVNYKDRDLTTSGGLAPGPADLSVCRARRRPARPPSVPASHRG